MDLESKIIGLLLTIFCYMTLPALKFLVSGNKYTEKDVKKFNLINSIIIKFIFIIITSIVLEETDTNFIPPFLYYEVNNWWWTKYLQKHNLLITDEQLELKKDNDKKIQEMLEETAMMSLNKNIKELKRKKIINVEK